jgi:N-acetylglutamate synthase
MTTPALIHTLESYTLRSWPALESHDYDGWTLRFASGYTRRSNSVSTLAAGTLPLVEKLAYVEQQYQQRGLPARFKLTPHNHPPDLDAALEANGYSVESRSVMMQADLSAPLEMPDGVTISETVDDAWIDLFCHFNPSHAPYRPMMPAFLAAIPLTRYFTTILQGDQPVALGLGVREGEYVGLYDIVTAEAMRGRGLGKRLVGAILARAQQDGARTAYLQVAAENTPAIRLYTGFGFTEAYPYWYRAKSV